MKIKVWQILAIIGLAAWLVVGFGDFIWLLNQSPVPGFLNDDASITIQYITALPYLLILVIVWVAIVCFVFVAFVNFLDTEIKI